MNSGLPQRPKLLVVDDQPLNIQVLYEALAPEGQVLMATTGEQALRVCRTQPPDLILLDVVMSGMDGHEVCRRLKADAATCDIPIIFVTAHDDASQEALGLEIGAADFIAKPVNLAVVRARVRTQLRLARSRSLLAATLEATADGILVTALDGSINSINGNFLRMWGMPAEWLSAPPHELVTAAMRRQLADATVLDALLQAAPAAPATAAVGDAATGDAGAPALLVLDDDRHFECCAAPLRVNARVSGQVLSFRDVSERHRAARQLQWLNETLESRIGERTRELEVAMQRADAANRAKSDFLSNMSHEIRTPINGVVGLLHLALQTHPADPLRGYLLRMQGASRHLQRIVNQILDFSKIEAGKLKLEAIDFELTQVLDFVESQTAEAASARGLATRYEIEASLRRRLRGDPLRLGQVLLNLVDNAIKFTARGGVTVRAAPDAAADAAQGAAGRVRIEVVDTGIGMSPAQIAEVFDAFQQADASTSRQYGGTGLGLAISRQLTALMGGEIGVAGNAAGGSTFWLSVPLPEAAPAAAGDGAAAAVQAAVPATPCLADNLLAGARLLVVDDHPLNRDVAAGLLRNVGAEVQTAADGREALHRLGSARFDCVLMDVQMPGMDGLQATRLIRATPGLERLPVLAMTAGARDTELQRCIAAGMDDFLTKPVDPDHLYATVARWLAPGAMPRDPATVPRPGQSEGRAAGGSVAAAAEMAAHAPDAPDVPHAPHVPVAAPAGSFDFGTLSRAVAGNPDKLRRYALMFVETTPETLDEMARALACGDLAALADGGHKLKSAARYVGAAALAAQCEALEALRDGDPAAHASELVGRISLMFWRVAADIQVELA